MSPKRKSAGKKPAATRKRKAAARKAAPTEPKEATRRSPAARGTGNSAYPTSCSPDAGFVLRDVTECAIVAARNCSPRSVTELTARWSVQPYSQTDRTRQRTASLSHVLEKGRRCVMLFLYWFLLVLAGSCVFLVVPTLLGWTIYDRYRGTRMVTCPQTQAPALVRLDAFHAACTGMFTTEKLRLANCTLWPQHLGSRARVYS